MAQHVYFVIDMKSFYASVECALRGLDPLEARLVVADNERTDKTICLAVSPALKKLGVKNRCRLFEVPKEYNAIIACPRMETYMDYCAKIYSIYLDYLSKDDIHVYSVDECFLDVTSFLKTHKMRAKAFALHLIKRINDELHIPATAGIGSNMYLAKVALDIQAKKSTDGIGWLDEAKFIKTLSNHTPITDFWRISTGTARRLAKYGVYDMEGIRNLDEDILYKEFGIDAELLIDHAKGIEPCLMKHVKEYKGRTKSISSSQILASSYGYNDALIVTKEMIQDGCYILARRKLVTNSIIVIYNYEDFDSTHARVKLSVNTNIYKYMIDPIIDECKKVLDKKKKVKRISYSFNAFDDKMESYDLFTDLNEVEKEKKLRDSIILIQNKYGNNALLKGIDYTSSATQIERNELIGGHRGRAKENKDVTK